MRASFVVNCQFTVIAFALRSVSHAAVCRVNRSASSMRLSKHCRCNTDNSILLAMRRASVGGNASYRHAGLWMLRLIDY